MSKTVAPLAVRLISNLVSFDWTYENSDDPKIGRKARADWKKIQKMGTDVCTQQNSKLGFDLIQLAQDDQQAGVLSVERLMNFYNNTKTEKKEVPVTKTNVTAGSTVGVLIDNAMQEGSTLMQALEKVMVYVKTTEENQAKEKYIAGMRRTMAAIAFPHAVSDETLSNLCWKKHADGTAFWIEASYYKANRERMVKFMAALQAAFNNLPDRHAKFESGFLKVYPGKESGGSGDY